MFESRRGTWAALWAAWGLCLTGFGCQVGGTADILRGSEKQGWASGPQVTRADYRSSLMGLDGSIAPAGGFKPATAALAKSSAPGENVALARMSGSPTTAASPPGAPCPPGGVPAGGPGVGFIPTELQKLSQPTYRIEPPDVLLIDTISMLPMPP